jgi:NADP-dependent aldehyde dehydrogenase
MVYGPGRDVGMALVKHTLIKAVGFTGSRAGGRALMDAAAARPEPIPVYAEMGSINPVFFLPQILETSADSLAAGLHASVTLGVGQFCTNPGLVFIQSSPGADIFLQKLESLIASTPAGSMLTPSICSEYHAGVEKFSRIPGVRRPTKFSPATNSNGSSAQAVLFVTESEAFLKNHSLMDEVFGPSTLVVRCASRSEMLAAATNLEGQLTATVHGTPQELVDNRDLLSVLETKAGRLLCNGFPTGVEVGHAMMHGGPYPATADGRSTSVGTRAITRFLRPVCYQNWPDAALPDELKDPNPIGLWRLIDGKLGLH